MSTVSLGIVTITFLAHVIVRRRRAHLSQKEQYLSPSGLRWLRAHMDVPAAPSSRDSARCRPIVT
jgi:hypothetical protein